MSPENIKLAYTGIKLAAHTVGLVLVGLHLKTTTTKFNTVRAVRRMEQAQKEAK